MKLKRLLDILNGKLTKLPYLPKRNFSRLIDKKKYQIIFKHRFDMVKSIYKEALYNSVVFFESSIGKAFLYVFIIANIINALYLFYTLVYITDIKDFEYFVEVNNQAKQHQINNYIYNENDLNRLNYSMELTKYY